MCDHVEECGNDADVLDVMFHGGQRLDGSSDVSRDGTQLDVPGVSSVPASGHHPASAPDAGATRPVRKRRDFPSGSKKTCRRVTITQKAAAAVREGEAVGDSQVQNMED